MQDLIPRAEKVARLLKERKETITVAESSTGGLISAALLALPGASAYFLGGAVVYTQTARKALLDVAELPDGMRASTEPYALHAARIARERFGAGRDRCQRPDRQPLRRRAGSHLHRGGRQGRAGDDARDRHDRPRDQHVRILRGGAGFPDSGAE